jgi:hypothetical protein
MPFLGLLRPWECAWRWGLKDVGGCLEVFQTREVFVMMQALQLDTVNVQNLNFQSLSKNTTELCTAPILDSGSSQCKTGINYR